MPPLTELVEKYRPLLFLVARQIRLDPKLQARFDVDDIVSEAVTRALSSLQQFRGTSEAEFVRWLQEVCRTTSLDMMRRQFMDKRSPEVEAAVNHSSVRLDQFLADQSLSPSMKAEWQEVARRFAEALEELDPRQREVVILRDLHKLPIKEIAEKLGETDRAVAGLLRRGRAALRSYFPDYREGQDDV